MLSNGSDKNGRYNHKMYMYTFDIYDTLLNSDSKGM